MGQSDAPSYDEIVGAPSPRRLARSPDLTPEQDSLLSTLPPETPFRTEAPVDPTGHNFDGSTDWGKVWQAAKEPIPYVGPAISDAVAKVAPSILRYGDVTGTQGILRSIYGDQTVDQANTGIGRGVGNLASGLVSPLGIASTLLAGAPAIVQRGAAGLFAADMARGIPAQVQAVGDAQTPHDRAQALTELVGGGAMALGAGAHAFGRPGLVSDADVSARRILRTSPPPSPLLGMTLAATPEGPISPPSVETAATQVPVISTTEPPSVPESASPHDYVPALNIAGEQVAGRAGDTHQDILNRWIDQNPDRAGDALVGFDTPENPNFFLKGDQPVSRDELHSALGVRDSQGLRDLQSAVEPMPSGQGQPPIAAVEGTPAEAAAAPATAPVMSNTSD